ncbi:MAG: pilin [Candidatus Moraniibacteriota bacterium]
MFYLITKAAESSDSGESSIVTCSGVDCNVCELVKTIVNIFQWFTWISAAVAILFIVIGGFIYIGARGNENLMAQAKKTIIWAIVGFALVLLAFMAIKATYQVVGATNQGFWEEIDCGDGVSGAVNSKDNTIPEQTVAGLLRGAKNGGIIAGRLSTAGLGDVAQLIDQLPEENMLIFSAASQNDRKPIMAIGKKDDQPELLYVDRTLINELLRSNKTTYSFLSIASAQSGDSEEINKLLSEITQVIQRLIEKHQELLVIIAERAGLDLGTNPIGNIPVSAIYNITNKVSQCFDSGGYWFLFNDICQATEQGCNATKCTPQDNFSLTASCQCPEGKCLSGSRCVEK